VPSGLRLKGSEKYPLESASLLDGMVNFSEPAPEWLVVVSITG
jgi:hypothetical protein